MRLRLLILLLLTTAASFAQQPAKGLIYGKVTDANGLPISAVNVAVTSLSVGTTTGANGYYELSLPSDATHEVTFSFVGYAPEKKTVSLSHGERIKLDIKLISTSVSLPDAVISDRALDATNLTKLNARQATLLPSVGGGIETLVKTLPGVVSNNELSSQYRVRGGNFDENIVYVNGIEIYRPFLVGSGQQEGLSFVNSRLVSNIKFSAGGFAAEYGDKMSSVLDVTYKRPRETSGSLTLSLLGAEAHVEGLTGKDKFSYLIGARYKNTSLALNMLDTKGSYRPNFTDVQALFNYSMNEKWDISFMGYYSKNQYYLIPEDNTTDFGTISKAYRLKIYFDGEELDDYANGMGALTLNFNPNNALNIKLIASAYSTYETETYDIQGQYFLGEREMSLGQETSGEVSNYYDVGTSLEHARNAFYAQIYNLDLKGTYANDENVAKWGVRFQHQDIDDVVSEWNMVDSAGYNLPHISDSIGYVPDVLPNIEMNDVNKANNILSINNMEGFVQDSRTFLCENGADIIVTAGLRANYWGYSNKVYFSPRAGIAYNPNRDGRDVVYRLSGGVYYQIPFYRELRNMDGTLYADSKPQQSYQIVFGNDYKFQAWGRPFILTSEAYFKYLKHIIPYDVDNVRIRYYADQSAKGYATGLDFKVNGEFVKGIDSWASLSLMHAMEDIEGDYYLVDANGNTLPFYHASPDEVADTIALGWHQRPSNQTLSFSLFFQDYIPKFPTWKVNMTVTFGSGLPVNNNASDFYNPTSNYKAYRRVDIGFVKQLINEGSSFSKGNPLQYVKNMYLSLEVFNLLNINNTISYTWVKDIGNTNYAVPTYLTPRYVNLKWVTEF